MNTNYIRVHSGCGGEIVKNVQSEYFLEEYLCLKCNKTTWDLGCRIKKISVKEKDGI